MLGPMSSCPLFFHRLILRLFSPAGRADPSVLEGTCSRDYLDQRHGSVGLGSHFHRRGGGGLDGDKCFAYVRSVKL